MRKWMIAVAVLGALLLAGPGLYAQDGGGFGIGAGIVKFTGSGASDTKPLWLTANLRVMLGTNFAIEPEAGWYRQSDEVFGVQYKTDAFNFGGSALLVLPAEKVNLWGGGGVGAHMFRNSVSGASDTTTKLGFHFLGGVDLKASASLSLFGAARYEIINTDTTDDLTQWKFYGGLRFTR